MGEVGYLFIKNGTIEDDKFAWRIDKTAFSLRKMRNFVGTRAEQIIDIEGNFAYVHDIIINNYSKNSIFSKYISINPYTYPYYSVWVLSFI